MKAQKLKMSALSLALALSGCAYFHPAWYNNPRINYKLARAYPPAYVPPGLSRTNVGDNYQIPAVRGAGAVPPSVYPPDGLYRPNNFHFAPTREQADADDPYLMYFKRDKTGQPILVVNDSPQDLSGKMSKALHQAGYEVVDAQKAAQSYTIKTKAGSEGVYQVHLVAQEQATNIVVTDNNNKPIQPGAAQTVLSHLANALENKHSYPRAAWLKRIMF